MMTLDQLRYFYEAARYQHIGKAAKSIHISPSAISSAIAALEEELELSLFDRQGKTIVLNINGRSLQSEAEQILSSFQGLKSRIKNLDGDLKGQFRVGASHFLAAHNLTRSASVVQSSHPELVFETCSMASSACLSEVLSGSLDFALCFSPVKHPELHMVDLHSGKLQIAVRKHHPLADKAAGKTLKALSDYQAVVFKANPGVDLCDNHPVFDEFEIEVKPSFIFDSDECAVQKLIHSDGWALLPDLVIKAHSRSLTTLSVPRSWHAPYRISAVVRRDRSKNAVLLKLMEKVAENFRK